MTDKNNIKAENGLLHVLGLLLHLDEQRKEINRSAVSSTAIQTAKTVLYEGFEKLSLLHSNGWC